LRDGTSGKRGSKGDGQNKFLHDLLRGLLRRGFTRLAFLPPFKTGRGESFVALYCRRFRAGGWLMAQKIRRPLGPADRSCGQMRSASIMETGSRADHRR
jgi:hypothetical protein